MAGEKFVWQILVPCNWNSGRPVRRRHHQEWDKVVRRIAGGLTILSPARGDWVDPDTSVVYRDRVIPVMIMATEVAMESIARFTIAHYRQLAVTYFKMSDTARMVQCTEEQRREFSERDHVPCR